MIRVTQTISQNEIDRFLMSEIERKEGVLVSTLSYVGETCVAHSRDNGKYLNQTGNLRSSIGYVVIRNGRVVINGGFEQVQNGSEGVTEGKKFRNDIISKNRRGIVLIMVAGMNYAAYVEAKNLDVLTSAELLAESLVPSLMNQLGFVKK